MAQASAENFEQIGPAEKESVVSALQRAVGKDARAAFANRKRNRAICLDHQIMR